jgi:alkylation response protein AidB-like acyl-CoA dehydrogenase
MAALLLLSSLARGRSRLFSSSSTAANDLSRLLSSSGTGIASGSPPPREERAKGDDGGFIASFSPRTMLTRAFSTSSSSSSASTSTPPPTMLASTRALSISGLDDDQINIFDAATDWSCREMAPFSAQWDSEKTFPLETVKRAAEMGFCSLTTPLEFGGSALSRHDASLVFEGLSYGDIPVAAYLTIHSMVSAVVARHGTAEQKAKWLPRLASAEALSAYALTEPSSGSDAAAMRTSAKLVRDPKDGSEWFEISGEKSFISGGGVADLYLVMAKVEVNEGEFSYLSSSKTSSITAFLVEKGTKGLSFGPPERKMGWNAQPTTSVSLNKVRVRARDSLLGVESGKSSGGGFKVAMQALDGGRVNIGAISVGGEW